MRYQIESKSQRSGRAKGMIPNHGGGFSFQIDDWKRLERFLIIGATNGTYYVGRQNLFKQSFAVLKKLAEQDSARFALTVGEVSRQGRAPRNSEALFALAVLASVKPQAAWAIMNDVARTGSHLLEFTDYCKQMEVKWNSARRAAYAAWYGQKTPDWTALQMLKYRSRSGWSHIDILRLAHVTAPTTPLADLFRYVVKGSVGGLCPSLVHGLIAAQSAQTERQVIQAIENYGLTWEFLPTTWLNSPDVWRALLTNMPLTAKIRNLSKMSSLNVLRPLSNEARLLASELDDEDALKRARIHPLNVLVALEVYRRGRGEKGDLTWKPNSTIADALEGAFYKSFQNVEPSGERYLIGLDVSGSMTASHVAGLSSMTARVASAAMAMASVRAEKQTHTVAFSDGIMDFPLAKNESLGQVIARMNGMDFSSTDCSAPFRYALENGLEVDKFVIYTDSETNANRVPPHLALADYQKETGIPAKLIVCGMTATNITIAQPGNDAMLDVVGFDSGSPAAISSF